MKITNFEDPRTPFNRLNRKQLEYLLKCSFAREHGVEKALQMVPAGAKADLMRQMCLSSQISVEMYPTPEELAAFRKEENAIVLGDRKEADNEVVKEELDSTPDFILDMDNKALNAACKATGMDIFQKTKEAKISHLKDFSESEVSEALAG